jgi:hypothetical protein
MTMVEGLSKSRQFSSLSGADPDFLVNKEYQSLERLYRYICKKNKGMDLQPFV